MKANHLTVIIIVVSIGLIIMMGQANVHSCVRATRKIWKMGTGELPGACMSCDPTVQYCQDGCQKLVKNMYNDCDGVCLPDGYYFDPKFQLSGCWGENKADVKIAVERCGCNSASTLHSFSLKLMVGIVVGIVGVLLV